MKDLYTLLLQILFNVRNSLLAQKNLNLRMAKNKVFIISGRSGEGKTSLLLQVIKILTNKGLNIYGFYAEGKWEQNTRSGHCLVEIGGESRIELCTTNKTEGWQKEDRFYFNPNAIKTGNNIIEQATESEAQLIVIDEIGPFELQGKIWAKRFSALLKSSKVPILITTKQKLINAVVTKFGITDFIEFPSNTSARVIVETLSERLKG